MNIIQQIEAEQAAQIAEAAKLPEFQPGDTVMVNVKVTEATAPAFRPTRASASPAAAAASTRASPSARFPTARASSACFPLYSPLIDSVKVVRRGKVRRAKLYYLRDPRPRQVGPHRRADGHEPGQGQGRGQGSFAKGAAAKEHILPPRSRILRPRWAEAKPSARRYRHG